MFNPKLAFFLSFIYCGLGQLYKHEISKGIVLIFIYTMLIISMFFYPIPSWLFSVGLLVTTLLWTINIFDAYLNTGGCINDDKGFVLEPLLNNTTFFMAFLACIFLASFWMQFINIKDINYIEEIGINEATISKVPEIKELDYLTSSIKNDVNTNPTTNNPPMQLKKKNDSDKLYQTEVYRANSKFYSLQVGAFQMLENAKELYVKLKAKEYQTWIEPPKPPSSKLYCVMIGEFKDKYSAISHGKKILKQEGLDYILVIKRQSEKIKFPEDEKIAYAD